MYNPITNRQLLINKLSIAGIEAPSRKVDQCLKIFNNFEMSLTDRMIILINNNSQFEEFKKLFED